MKLPNFLIIGCPKAGTTSLSLYISQHPEVFMSPVKECCFFAFENERPDFCGPGDEDLTSRIITDINTYSSLFQGASNEKAIGESSVWYLYIPKAASKIKKYVPNMKLIVILRDPIERAYSSFLMTRRDGREQFEDFAFAIKEEETRIRNNWEYIWHYKHAGFYYNQIKHYLNIFNRRQIKVYLYEDFKTNPISLLRDIYHFLDVDTTFIPDMSSKINISGIPKSKALQGYLNNPNLMKNVLKRFLPAKFCNRIKTNLNIQNLSKPNIPKDIQKQLIDIYSEDILKLQDIINRDLSKWLYLT